LTTFPFGKHIVGKLNLWTFGNIFGFNINVGVYEKLAKKVTIVLPKLKCKQQTVATRGPVTGAAAADGQLAYS